MDDNEPTQGALPLNEPGGTMVTLDRASLSAIVGGGGDILASIRVTLESANANSTHGRRRRGPPEKPLEQRRPIQFALYEAAHGPDAAMRRFGLNHESAARYLRIARAAGYPPDDNSK
jgi:hypothetical protein